MGRVGRRPADGDVDRRPDTDLVRRLDHGPRQVEGQSRVHPADLGGVVTPPVVALGEDGDRVEPPQPERALEVLLAKLRAHVGDALGRMKIEVDLS